MKIYVASSWRNPRQPRVVTALKAWGYEVYDFRNPKAGNKGFHWSEIDHLWQQWSPRQYRSGLEHPLAIEGFELDKAAMLWAEVFVLVLPCGRSSHLELGWACGQGKPTIVLLDSQIEPELMYKLATKVVLNLVELRLALKELPDA